MTIVNKIRYGSLMPMRASCTFSHGLAPGKASFEFPSTPYLHLDRNFYLQLGGNAWGGRITSNGTSLNVPSGRTTSIECVDTRINLQKKQIRACFNMREDDGRLYSITPDDWDTQTRTYKGYYARYILSEICDIAGFGSSFSRGALSRLKYEDTDFDDWLTITSDLHCWNLDWNTGKTCGTALVAVCNQIGLQFTLKDGESDTLRFTVKGEYPSFNLRWNGAGAVSVTSRSDVDLQVDTGVYIVGDRAACEMEVGFEPAWDEREWEWWGWNRVAFEKFVMDNRLDTTILPATITVGEVNTLFLKKPAPHEDKPRDADDITPQVWEGKPVWKMRAVDYLKTFPLRLYSIKTDDMPAVRDPYTGVEMIPTLPLADKLVTCPNTDMRIWATVRRQGIRYRWLVKEGYVVEEEEELLGGATLDREKGTVHFDRMRFRYTRNVEAAKPNAATSEEREAIVEGDVVPDLSKLIDWRWDDIAQEWVAVDEPYYDTKGIRAIVVFQGPMFRRAFGKDDRVGSISGKSLKRKYLCKKVDGEWESVEQPFLWWDPTGEIFGGEVGDPDKNKDKYKKIMADHIAELLANSHLDRQRQVDSGSAEYRGFIGHYPDGWIQQVRASLDANQGLTEHVSFSNEMAHARSGNVEDMQKRLLLQQKQSELDVIQSVEDERTAKKMALLIQAAQTQTMALDSVIGSQDADWDPYDPSTFEEIFDGNAVSNVVVVAQSVPPEVFYKGEIICVEKTEEGPLRAIASSSVVDDDTRAFGICVSDVAAEPDAVIRACSHGPISILGGSEVIAVGDAIGTEAGLVIEAKPGTGFGKALEAWDPGSASTTFKADVNTVTVSSSGGSTMTVDTWRGNVPGTALVGWSWNATIYNKTASAVAVLLRAYPKAGGGVLYSSFTIASIAAYGQKDVNAWYPAASWVDAAGGPCDFSANWTLEASVSTAGRTNADIQANGFVSDGTGLYNMRFTQGDLLNS